MVYFLLTRCYGLDVLIHPPFTQLNSQTVINLFGNQDAYLVYTSSSKVAASCSFYFKLVFFHYSSLRCVLAFTPAWNVSHEALEKLPSVFVEFSFQLNSHRLEKVIPLPPSSQFLLSNFSVVVTFCLHVVLLVLQNLCFLIRILWAQSKHTSSSTICLIPLPPPSAKTVTLPTKALALSSHWFQISVAPELHFIT